MLITKLYQLFVKYTENNFEAELPFGTMNGANHSAQNLPDILAKHDQGAQRRRQMQDNGKHHALLRQAGVTEQYFAEFKMTTAADR